MKRKQIITAIPFILSLMLFSIRIMTPSYVDAQGILHEAFYLIPLAYLSLFIGIGMIIFNLLMNKKSKIN